MRLCDWANAHDVSVTVDGRHWWNVGELECPIAVPPSVRIGSMSVLEINDPDALGLPRWWCRAAVVVNGDTREVIANSLDVNAALRLLAESIVELGLQVKEDGDGC